MKNSALVLSSSRLCPYGVRCLAMLGNSGLAYQLDEITDEVPRAARLALSPTGLLPVLRSGEVVVFESAAICEFIQEAARMPSPLADPTQAAAARSWSSYASLLYPLAKAAIVAKCEADFVDARQKLATTGAVLEHALARSDAKWARTHLCETAFLPFFSRLEAVERQFGMALLEGCPRLTAWSEQVLALYADAHPWVTHHGRWFLDHFRSAGSQWLVESGSLGVGAQA